MHIQNQPLRKTDRGVSILDARTPPAWSWPQNYVRYTRLRQQPGEAQIYGVRWSSFSKSHSNTCGLQLTVKYCIRTNSAIISTKTSVPPLLRHHVSTPRWDGYLSAATPHLTEYHKTRFRHVCCVQGAQESLQVTERGCDR